MLNSLCERITRKMEHNKVVMPAPISGVYVQYMCVWLSGSTVETPNGWPHGNSNNAIHEA